MKRTVLIIKLGYCETLVNEKGFVPSLGDVFRHTVLLHHYADCKVTWLTSKAVIPLLAGNPFIEELLTYDVNTPAELSNRQFDEVLCLEKSETICKMVKSIKADKYLGFRWHKDGVVAHPGAESAMDIANGQDQFLPIQALLFQMVDSYWHGENYVLGYQPKPREQFDIGFNYQVGSKWPSKSWPMSNWKKLEEILKGHGIKVSWQDGTNDLNTYMDWINAGRMILTCDSLGMHLGLAMKKKVIALFGPTPSEAIYMYGRGVIVTADWACAKAPCMRAECPDKCLCMTEIRPKTVARTVINLLNGKT